MGCWLIGQAVNQSKQSLEFSKMATAASKASKSYGKAMKKSKPKTKYIGRWKGRYSVPKTLTTSGYTVIKRTFEFPPVLSVGGGIPFGKAFSFALGNLPNYTDFTNLFDFYKILKIVVRFEPTFTDVNLSSEIAAPGLLNNVKHYRVVHDFNDDTPPASETELFQYSNLKSHAANCPFEVVLYPKVAQPVYSGVLAGYQAAPPSWCDSAYVNVVHYGLKMWVPGMGNIAQGALMCRVIPTFYVALKNPK